VAATRSSTERLRQRIRDERERRGWSQHALGAKLSVHSTAITRIEQGSRAIQVDELIALADIFGLSVDALLGRNPGTSDVLWAVSKLTSNAQKIAGEIVNLQLRLHGDLDDVRSAGDKPGVRDIRSATLIVIDRLDDVKTALLNLANQFPIPKGVE
jgi:transcriptional regulator with XRE-family HTH domain